MWVRIRSRGRFVLPAGLRRKYGLKPGDRVHLVDYAGVIALVPAVDDPIERAAGLLAGGPSLTEALRRERLAERRRGRPETDRPCP